MPAADMHEDRRPRSETRPPAFLAMPYVDGPVPVGDEPAGLLRSAEQLLRRVTTPGSGTGLDGLRTQVADLVWEANTGVGG